MKIMFLSDDFPPTSFGGAGISTYELALGMKKAGHEVFVITTCRKAIDAGEIEYNGLKIFKITSDYPSRWRAYVSLYNASVVRQVKKILERIRPDIVHVNNIHFYLSYHCLKLAKQYANGVVFTARDTMSFCYGKLSTKRYVENFDCRTTWHDHLNQAKKGYNPFRNFCIKMQFKNADRLVSVSNALKTALEQNGIGNVAVIHTGEDVDRWYVAEEKVFQFREKHKLKNKKIVLFGGRLSEAKGGHTALEALTEIVKVVPDTVLLVAGTLDEYAERMKAQAKIVGIENSLVFTGWIEQDEIKLAYAAADVVLVPSLCLDSFPRIVIEGMASGKPVVGTCYGGASEIIVDGVTGYVVDPRKPEEIALKTIDLLKDSEKAMQFGKAGYERIKKDFNIENKVKEYMEVYTSILNRETH